MREFLAACVFVLTCSTAWALSFPELTGRVVDAAHILSPANSQSLDQTLADFEKKTTDQIVIATIPSLEAGTIEDYGYQLGRHWGIGQKGKDNGVILLVAPHERKVRIEVGYGLEGALTDAQSNQIIQNIILPDFRRGDMQTGIVAGTQAIIETLDGKADATFLNSPSSGSSPLNSSPVYNQPHATSDGTAAAISAFVLILLFLIGRMSILPSSALLSSSLYGGGSSAFGGSGFGGGGFSGGGGSFGGGGASGGW